MEKEDRVKEKASIEDKLQAAIQYAIKNGFVIKPRALFSFARKECNAIGALLFMFGKHVDYYHDIPQSYLKDICALLNVTPGWLWRFTMGFDYGNVIIFESVDKEGNTVYTKDKISTLGYKLAKQYVVMQDRT